MLDIISHQNRNECEEFFSSYLAQKDRSILFVGTLGFNQACLNFPRLISSINVNSAIEFLFLDEWRPDVSPILETSAQKNRAALQSYLGQQINFEKLIIIAEDTANVAGRNAAALINYAIKNAYTDIIVDATTMSRGVCFPVVRFAYEQSKSMGFEVHVVVSEEEESILEVTSMSKDSAEYMHGFQGKMETDEVDGSINLWLPQLSESNFTSLKVIYDKLLAEEVAPILPFPSTNPRRGDNLLRRFHDPLINEWETNLLDIIYAHESDPTDVFATIKRIEQGRKEALSGYTHQIILSPTGRKTGSIGMLFAAIDLDLPVIYTETMGYRCDASSIPNISNRLPQNMWHNWLLKAGKSN